jgi:uncharacterized protein (DUF2267 family)
MKYDELLARIRKAGEYKDNDEAERVLRGVLRVLGQRLDEGEAKDLAAQLPQPAQSPLLAMAGPAESFGVEEFLRRVAATTGGTPESARWDASAVLTTIAEAISGGELNDVLTQLPAGYAVLFGKPDLS